MNDLSALDTQNRPAGPRPGFVVALVISLGVACVGLQTIEPVRQAFGLDPMIPPLVQTAVVAPETPRFDGPASVQGIERLVQPAPTRHLGSGTRRAVRLAPAAVAPTASPETMRRPDATRRDDAVLGPVRYGKLDDALRRVVDGDPAALVRVIMQTQPGQQAPTARWLTTAGRTVHRLHPSFDGLTVTLSAADVAALSGDPSIARLSTDEVVTAARTDSISRQLLRDALGLRAGDDVRSSGGARAADTIGVALLDSGIESSQDLEAGRVVAFYDFTDGGTEVHSYDDYRHATHVAWLTGGSGHVSSHTDPVALSRMHLVGYKVLDASGAGYTSDVVAAIEHATANKDALDIDVMNLPLAHPIWDRAAGAPLVRAVRNAADAGLLVVWSDRRVWGGRVARGDPLGVIVNHSRVVEAGS